MQLNPWLNDHCVWVIGVARRRPIAVLLNPWLNDHTCPAALVRNQEVIAVLLNPWLNDHTRAAEDLYANRWACSGAMLPQKVARPEYHQAADQALLYGHGPGIRHGPVVRSKWYHWQTRIAELLRRW